MAGPYISKSVQEPGSFGGGPKWRVPILVNLSGSQEVSGGAKMAGPYISKSVREPGSFGGGPKWRVPILVNLSGSQEVSGEGQNGGSLY